MAPSNGYTHRAEKMKARLRQTSDDPAPLQVERRFNSKAPIAARLAFIFFEFEEIY